jgi:hypothetical protein
MPAIDPNRPNDWDQGREQPAASGPGGLAAWVMAHVQRGRNVRDQKYGSRWAEYTRLWRGFWDPSDKNFDSERSKLIAPALQQSIEMTVAEMEEATFTKEAWFDVSDDYADEQKEDLAAYRDMLLQDFEATKIPDAIARTFLLGALYGTGISKLNVIQKVVQRYPGPDGVEEQSRVLVTLEAIRPDEFVIDPSSTTIEDALFCAHEMVRPLHKIKEKQALGIYEKTSVGPYGGKKGNPSGTNDGYANSQDEGVLITEYYGKVPGYFLKGEEAGPDGMVEAIVTIANESILLRATGTPYTMKDRPIIAYQHDTVPGEFWGRGIAEKGYNPQKALDSELRARIDALAMMNAPMLGVDIGRLTRNQDLRVRPGKILFGRGNPNEIFSPISLQANLAATFQHTGDLERMVQMATGAMDSATPVGVNSRNETMGGMSMMQGGMIKRNRRTMQNVERQYLDPLIKKSLWRYMQFEPDRYKYDMDFQVHSTMGIMAKEVETQQLVQMLGFVPPESPAHMLILKAIFMNTVSAEKQSLLEAIEAMTQKPTPEQEQEQQMMKQLQMRQMQATVSEIEGKAIKAQADAAASMATAQYTTIKADLEDEKIAILATNAATGAAKTKIAEAQTIVSARKAVLDAQAKLKAAAMKPAPKAAGKK